VVLEGDEVVSESFGELREPDRDLRLPVRGVMNAPKRSGWL
jgi:hypothetical protein